MQLIGGNAPILVVRDRLVIDDTDGMVVVSARVVIPKSFRQHNLRDLLLMHQSATKLRQRARLTVYWPNIDVDITNATRSCKECTSRLPSHQREPLRPMTASRPFEQVHASYGSFNGRQILVIVDQFSEWPHVVPFQNCNTTARRLINAVRSYNTSGASGRFCHIPTDGRVLHFSLRFFLINRELRI